MAVKKTQAIVAYVSGGGEALYPPMDFLTRIMSETEEDARAILDNLEGEALPDEKSSDEETPSPSSLPGEEEVQPEGDTGEKSEKTSGGAVGSPGEEQGVMP